MKTVADIVAGIRGGEASAEEVSRRCLDAIDAIEPTLLAWAHLDHDGVLEQARDRDRLQAEDPAFAGPLHGVPIGVKDIVDVAGMPTTNGADIPVAAPATTDAVAVARLRDAGAIIVGKTVSTEFALFRPGPTTHPLDRNRTPGGSSSGSAAAVGAGTVPLAVGTQTAGSIVRPASFCGIVGGKPSLGSVPRDGVTLCSHTLDTVGLLGSDIEGVALGLGVMAADPKGFTPAPVGDGLRVGFCRTSEWEAIPPATQAVVEHGVERLSRHLDIVEVPLPRAMQRLAETQRTIMLVECAQELAGVRARHEALLSPLLLQVLDDGEALRPDYDRARDRAARGQAVIDELFADVDVLVAPSVLGEAPTGETTGDPLLCRMWTLLGTPTVSVPGLTGPDGLPVGAQVIAAPGRDDVALGGAQRVEAHLGDDAAVTHA